MEVRVFVRKVILLILTEVERRLSVSSTDSRFSEVRGIVENVKCSRGLTARLYGLKFEG